MIDERAFECEASSVAEARRFVTESLSGYDPEIAELAALLVSELATNCVRYATGDFDICVEHNGHGIRIEVSDEGQRRPEMRSPEPSDLRGRGLRIVDELSAAWGVTEHPENAGKTVWFTLEAAPLRPTRG